MLKKLSSCALVAVFACGTIVPIFSGSASAVVEELDTVPPVATEETEITEVTPEEESDIEPDLPSIEDEQQTEEPELEEPTIEEPEIGDSQELPQPGQPVEAPITVSRSGATRVTPEATIATITQCAVPPAIYQGALTAGKELRLGGATRYDTAAKIASAVKSAPKGAGRAVFIASGTGFADGLSLGALASLTGWPLLLTAPNTLSPSVEQQIKSLKPTHIFIAGGTKTISAAIENKIRSLSAAAPVVTRFSGNDRYHTSQLIAECFPAGAPAMVVTGANFPDAVVAGGVAANFSGAVILTPTSAFNQNSLKALKKLAPGRTYFIGGKWDTKRAPATAGLAPSSVRFLSGSDRYATSAAVAKHFYGATPASMIFAVGSNYPDALSGVSVAKLTKAPIVLSRPDCRPKTIEAVTGKVSRAILLGNGNSLSTKSYSKTCVPAPKPKPTVVDHAHAQKGIRYTSGGNNPQAGFDCSGLTSYVYAQTGKNIPRTSYGQMNGGTRVANPVPGDVVVMLGGGHVGIYIGNGQMIHAAKPGTTVSVSPVFSVDAYVRF